MSKVTRVGVDLVKNVIQVHAVDACGNVLTNHSLKRENLSFGVLICRQAV